MASLEVLEVSDGAGEDGLSPHRHCDVGHLAQEPRLSLLMVVTCTIVATYKKDCWVTGITCTTGILRREFPMIHSIYIKAITVLQGNLKTHEKSPDNRVSGSN